MFVDALAILSGQLLNLNLSNVGLWGCRSRWIPLFQ